jgi:hypothetical protein
MLHESHRRAPRVALVVAQPAPIPEEAPVMKTVLSAFGLGRLMVIYLLSPRTVRMSRVEPHAVAVRI